MLFCRLAKAEWRWMAERLRSVAVSCKSRWLFSGSQIKAGAGLFKDFAHAFVTSCLDYCRALSPCITQPFLKHLQFWLKFRQQARSKVSSWRLMFDLFKLLNTPLSSNWFKNPIYYVSLPPEQNSNRVPLIIYRFTACDTYGCSKVKFILYQGTCTCIWFSLEIICHTAYIYTLIPCWDP